MNVLFKGLRLCGRLWLATALTLLLTACTPYSSTFSVNDFEAPTTAGWHGHPETRTQAQAHSGRYALAVDKSQEYSMGYEVALGRASLGRAPYSLRVEAWAWLPSAAAAAHLVVVLTDPARHDTVIAYHALPLLEQVTAYCQWRRVTLDVPLTATTQPGYYLKAYLWRAGATAPAYLDDVRLTARY